MERVSPSKTVLLTRRHAHALQVHFIIAMKPLELQDGSIDKNNNNDNNSNNNIKMKISEGALIRTAMTEVTRKLTRTRLMTPQYRALRHRESG